MIMYKAFNNMLPMNLQKLCICSVEIRHTRQVNTFKQMYIRTKMKTMYLMIHKVKFWKKKIYLKSCRNMHAFKARYKVNC